MKADVLQWPGLLLFVADLMLLGAFVCWPIFHEFEDDQGDGQALVLLPPPHKVHPMRTVGFFVFFALLALVYASFVNPQLDRVYGDLVGSIAGMALRDPSHIAAYIATPLVGARLLIVGYIAGLALVARVTMPRRLLMALNALWYILAMMLMDAGLIILSILTGLPVRPFSPVGTLVAIGVGLVCAMRLLFTSFALPRKLAVRSRARVLGDSLVMSLVLLAVGLALVAVLLLIGTAAAQSDPALIALLAPFVVVHLFLGLVTLVLYLLQTLNPDPPVWGNDVPAIDVIMPAYNEELMIRDTLNSIDRAALRYPGPVRAIVGEDGSTDDTVRIAHEAIAKFRFASGLVVSQAHGGKSRALNNALCQATSDIVVRIDADTQIDEWALHYLPRWFRDPAVGEVGALNMPQAGPSWITSMRLFECLFGFGFSRRALQVVDGIACVPGTFSAFRRSPVVAMGGFTVGMNGEDADLTLQLGRLGYRSCMDAKIRVYEDVPQRVRGLREQRIRWNRAGTQVLARHAPFRGGIAGPRVWFSMLRNESARVTGPLWIMVLIYLLTVFILVPAYRTDIPRTALMVAVALVPTVLAGLLLAVRYERVTRVLWLIALWLPFSFLRRVFALESVLSLPGRPVRLRIWSRRPSAVRPVTSPVVH